jgi:hypothetical protein
MPHPFTAQPDCYSLSMHYLAESELQVALRQLLPDATEEEVAVGAANLLAYLAFVVKFEPDEERLLEGLTSQTDGVPFNQRHSRPPQNYIREHV